MLGKEKTKSFVPEISDIPITKVREKIRRKIAVTIYARGEKKNEWISFL